ncbi:uncharacterized protein L201_001119 [Kwoniella dendrophila CBS 6074]|uniref:Cep57 centrosome microtubule-binding domain-containing protein n=1 Tax=Kwoniella dendrophila CBS 6074 TaxID=1295534 RepID=A0AAX4JLG4_9TREE
MNAPPIFPSNSDLERRRLESTIDNDLYSLSISSIPTSTTSHSNSNSFLSSHSSNISLEYPRAETMSFSSHQQPNHHFNGPSETPRASRSNGRISSFGAPEQSMFVGASPVSTAGHHASAVTLGAGLFGKSNGENDNTSEFDPERSLGRLVGELGRVMGSDRLPSRPTSPFSPPRSPSPLPSVMNSQPANLSFTLTRNDPLLSPPSSGGEQTITQKNFQPQSQTQTLKSKLDSNTNSRFSSLARELGEDIRAARQTNQPRRALSDSTSHNIQNTPFAPKNKDKSSNRLKTLQDENRRSASAPVRSTTKDNSMDVTGYTNLMATPAKGVEHGTLGKNGEVGGDVANLAGTLATLNARLRALETENSVSRRRVRELEDELEKAKNEVELAKQDGGKRLREVIGEKSALEQLVKSLRENLARLTLEVESNKALINELRLTQSSPPKQPPRRNHTVLDEGQTDVKAELIALRKEIERLSKEVSNLGGIVEEGLETRKKSRGERTMRMEREEMELLVKQVIEQENQENLQRAKKVDDYHQNGEKMQTVEPSKLRQGLHFAASVSPTLAPPTLKPTRIFKSQQSQPALPQNLTPPPSDLDENEINSPTPISRSSSRQGSASLVQEKNLQPKKARSKSSRRVSHSIRNDHSAAVVGPSSPFPSIIGDELETEFFSPSRNGHWSKHDNVLQADLQQNNQRSVSGSDSQNRETGSARRGLNGEELPPQTVLSRVIRELEDDFNHYKQIYSELADQYKLLDPASISSKRHVLADHLKEVIDILENKADQIGDLYELLSFQNKPLTNSQEQQQRNNSSNSGKYKSVNDVLRMVKSSLGEDVWNRLENDLIDRQDNRDHNGRRRKSGGKEI